MGVFYFDTTSASQVTKVKYTRHTVDFLVMKSPFFGRATKETDGGGSSYNGTLNIAPMASASPVDTIAAQTGGPSVYAQWTCPWYDYYATANITSRAIAATNGSDKAMVRAIVAEADRSYETFGRSMGTMVWGLGGGSIGKLNGSGSVTGVAALTLSNVNQILNFYKGQVLNFATTNGLTGAVEAGSVTVAAIDINNGTITPTANWNSSVTTIANSDYIFQQGSFGLFAPGVPGWIPDKNNRPGATDSFNGQNRFTLDPTLSAGVFYDGKSNPKDQSLFQLLTLCERLTPAGSGQGPTDFYLNPVDYADVVRSLTSRTQNVIEKAYNNPQIGFDGVEIVSDRGAGKKIFKDPFVLSGNGYALDMESWVIASMGEIPYLTSQDGLEWARQSAAFAYQRRIEAHYTTFCSGPYRNGVVTF